MLGLDGLELPRTFGTLADRVGPLRSTKLFIQPSSRAGRLGLLRIGIWSSIVENLALADRVLYLDFDGVLHHGNVLWHPRKEAYLCAPTGHRLFQHAELLAEILSPYADLKIVLSTSWVVKYGHGETAKRLPMALRQRVVGSTLHSRMIKEEFRQTPRGQQIWSDVVRRRPHGWIALDDDDEDWPSWCQENLVCTDEVLGLSAPSVQDELRLKLQKIYADDRREPSPGIPEDLPE